MKNNKQAFTLIELLVVVLIIGILAAVALPQYNKAVRKAHGTELLLLLDTLDKNINDNYLQNSTYKNCLEGIKLPELHHFQYLVGCGGKSTKPQNVASFLYKPSEGAATEKYYATFYAPKDVVVKATWEQGKSVSIDCEIINKSTANISCGDYFNCGAEPFRYNGSIYLGGECKIK